MSAVMWNDDPNGFEMVHSYAVPSGELPSGALSIYFDNEVERGWSQTIHKLIGMRNLSNNWDGEDSDAPQPEVIDSILEYIGILRGRNMPSPSRVSASPNGDVLLEWQEGNNYLEAEFSEPYNVEWMLKESDAPAIHWKEDLASDNAVERYYLLSKLNAVA